MLRLGAPLVVAGCVFFSLVIAVTGGFSATVFGSHVAVHDPMRPFFVATVIGVLFVIGSGATEAWHLASGLTTRISARAAALTLAVAVAIVALAYATTVAGDPESYVNVSTADLIRSGSLKAPQPAVAQVPWPAAGWTFAPLGYRPVDDEG